MQNFHKSERKFVILYLSMNRLRTWFSQASVFLFKHRLFLSFFILSAVIVGGVFGGADVVLAQSDTLGAITATARNTLMGLIAGIFNVIAWMLGQLIVLLISIMLTLIQYDAFGSSQVVLVGWQLVRDLMNMFVIVILLVIAVQTMVGAGRVDWKQQLPKLFIAVIAMNFSKTITLFMIDIGQVIMVTFANAISEVGAGNFAEFFNLSRFYELNEDAGLVAGTVGSGIEAFKLLGTTIAMVWLLALVASTLILLTAALMYRIVVLWILIVISPLAFFAQGVGATLGGLQGVYGDWWKRLTGAIAFGPIMLFFLWLGLAVASSGSIATDAGFDPQLDASGNYFESDFLVEVFSLDQIMGVIVGVALIMVGFQTASQQASSVGGFAAKAISADGGMATMLARRTLATGANYAGKGAYAGYRRTGAPAVFKDYAQNAVRFGERQAQSSFAPLAAVGRATSNVAGMAENRLELQENAVRDSAKKRYESRSDTQRAMDYERMMTPGFDISKLNESDQAFSMFIASNLMQNKFEQKRLKERLQKQYGEPGGQERYDLAMKQALKVADAKEEVFGAEDKSFSDNLYKAKVKNLHLLDEKDVKKVISDERFKTSMISAESLQEFYVDPKTGEYVMDPQTKKYKTVPNQKILDALDERVMGYFNDQENGGKRTASTALDQLNTGVGGVNKDVQNYLSKLSQNKNYNPAVSNNIQKMSEAIGAKQAVLRPVTDEEVKAGVYPIAALDFAGSATDPKAEEQARRVVQATVDAAVSGADLSDMATDVRDALVAKIDAIQASNTLSLAEQSKYKQAKYLSTGNLNDVEVNSATGSVANPILLQQVISTAPAAVAQFDAKMLSTPSLTGGGNHTDAGKVIAQNASKLLSDLHSRAQRANATELKDIQAAVMNVMRVLRADDAVAARKGAVVIRKSEERERLKDYANLVARDIRSAPGMATSGTPSTPTPGSTGTP